MQTNNAVPKSKHEINAERQREIDNAIAATSRRIELDRLEEKRRLERELAEPWEFDS